MKRVVLTGVGFVSPLGCGSDLIWRRLLNGANGVKKIVGLEIPRQCPVSVAACVPRGDNILDGDYNEKLIFPKQSSKEYGNFVNYALYAADLAVKDAKLNTVTEFVCATRAGVAIGTGGVAAIDDINMCKSDMDVSYKKVSPYFVPKILLNMAAGNVSIRHGLKGPVHSVATACAAGCHSIGDAYNLIRLGYADLMLAGGTDANVNPLSIAGFARMKALSHSEDIRSASRPFDCERNGFVIGEGSAVVVLEELSMALSRGAPIIAEVCGYGLCGDAYHPTSPSQDGEGAQRCMAMALSDAGLQPHNIGYINAHATSTPSGDSAEVRAIIKTFGGEHSTSRTMPLLVSSTKGATGHLLGASGAMEAAFAALSVKSGMVPLTLNLATVQPEMNGDGVFSHVLGHSLCYQDHSMSTTSVASELRYTMSNSFGFGGINASLIFGRYSP